MVNGKAYSKYGLKDGVLCIFGIKLGLSSNNFEGDVPYEFQAYQTVEVTVYYIKYGPGGSVARIDPVTMRVWGNVYPPEWLDIPEELLT